MAQRFVAVIIIIIVSIRNSQLNETQQPGWLLYDLSKDIFSTVNSLIIALK